jgi:hypothetical protein
LDENVIIIVAALRAVCQIADSRLVDIIGKFIEDRLKRGRTRRRTKPRPWWRRWLK